ncbi:SDR family NAD(P)-dependent oxidoreductase [Natrinema sp. 1APR25-10V2]|uniref:SDR family NAD(P)-dependent oxidoreductase n=1 Tax=Natrinema sp. 1APR25-10V2 TaxID=2951081 RepID=UPI00287697E5|nr:SDR family NAD(P)-dependent oxidoreductase [Natrinema sp. 1APR25-10V2]MDS0474574.1 SDR family NAD(P)-dependent oxidoreductase [Natrinema sp. 1APR25-10V2]
MSESVLVTDTSSGIGRATARAFLDDGWTVYATARQVEDIANLDREGCEAVRLDVTDTTSISEVLDDISGGRVP